MTSIGVGVFVVRLNPVSQKNEILIGRRAMKNKRAPGVWALPGGMREDNETITDCTRREIREETSLDIDLDDYICNNGIHHTELQPCVIGVSDHYPRESHITFWVLAYYKGGTPQVLEPSKHDCWEWHDPRWVFESVPQVGEQIHWTPHEVWRAVLKPYNFLPF